MWKTQEDRGQKTGIGLGRGREDCINISQTHVQHATWAGRRTRHSLPSDIDVFYAQSGSTCRSAESVPYIHIVSEQKWQTGTKQPAKCTDISLFRMSNCHRACLYPLFVLVAISVWFCCVSYHLKRNKCIHAFVLHQQRSFQTPAQYVRVYAYTVQHFAYLLEHNLPSHPWRDTAHALPRSHHLR